MTTFIGDYYSKIDEKGRVVFPSVLKKQIQSEGNRFVIKKHIYENCLVLYTMAEWENENKQLRARLNPYNKEHNRFMNAFYKGAAELEMDAASRLLFPKRLLEMVKIEKEVVFAAQDRWIKVWAKEIYETDVFISDDEYAELGQKLLGNSMNIEDNG